MTIINNKDKKSNKEFLKEHYSRWYKDGYAEYKDDQGNILYIIVFD